MIKTYNDYQKVTRYARKDGSISLFIKLEEGRFYLENRLNVGAEDDFGYWAHEYYEGISSRERYGKLKSLEDIRDMWNRIKGMEFRHENDKRLVIRELKMMYKERKTRVELYGKAVYTRIYWPEDWRNAWDHTRTWSDDLNHFDDMQKGMTDLSTYLFKMEDLPKEGKPLRKLPDGFYKWAGDQEEAFFIRTVKEHELSSRGWLQPGDRVVYCSNYETDDSLFGCLQDDALGEEAEAFANAYFGIGKECSTCRGGGCIHCEPQHFL